MKEEIKFTNRYGTEYTLEFEKTSYVYGGTAIEVWCHEPGDGDGYWEPYATLTVRIGEFCFGPKVAYLDTNNVPELVDFVLEHGWAKVIGEGRSGFCTYPLVEFADEFLNGICITEGEN